MVSHRKLYRKVGSRMGWDFRALSKRTKVVGKKWKFPELVEKRARGKTILDVGTGGGELLLRIAKHAKTACGIDVTKEMIRTARRNLRRSGLRNVEFTVADSRKLPYPDGCFDVVMCRHAPFYAREVARVLRPGGTFMTQQVTEDDKLNVKKVFGRSGHGTTKPGTLLKKCLADIRRSGLKIVRKDRYDATEYYSMDDMIFLLKNTPIVCGLDVKRDAKKLEELDRRFTTRYGIRTNATRFLLICRKPKAFCNALP